MLLTESNACHTSQHCLYTHLTLSRPSRRLHLQPLGTLFLPARSICRDQWPLPAAASPCSNKLALVCPRRASFGRASIRLRQLQYSCNWSRCGGLLDYGSRVGPSRPGLDPSLPAFVRVESRGQPGQHGDPSFVTNLCRCMAALSSSQHGGGGSRHERNRSEVGEWDEASIVVKSAHKHCRIFSKTSRIRRTTRLSPLLSHQMPSSLLSPRPSRRQAVNSTTTSRRKSRAQTGTTTAC